MQRWLDKLIDISAIEGTQNKIEDALADLTNQMGFHSYAYLNLQPGRSLAITNYNREWRSIYFQLNYPSLDPVIKRAKSIKRIFVWAGELERTRLSKDERKFYAHAAEFGIRSGITIPVKTANSSISMFTVASEKREINLRREIDAVSAASAVGQLHTRFTFLRAKPQIEDPAYLDPKEATYLRWIAVGKTMEEVAVIEGVKYNTVRVKIAEAMKRFDVHTVAHLTAIAVRKNLI
ncbi:autoinducer-binding transcriptional regulator TraR [Agrobacterium vitis]|uniref:autoinducer-binding transcriptional regulator TraR n=1 Tax=Agrobacterium vitis TaxID=373 RepID=UPI001572EFCA|nr:transcriptional regulator TraR [Agrobacterium vitis]NSZ19612.1 transcriptional regulator TraR [Agrobacterium vitis]QZO07198.1 transcriptional regulator TraR [Agrobacterium vitis]UJL91103.1 transcriptional regulator TraR [Agrobacterium vitis]